MSPDSQPQTQPRRSNWIGVLAAAIFFGAVALHWHWRHPSTPPAGEFKNPQQAFSEMRPETAIRVLGANPGVFSALYEKVYPHLPKVALEQLAPPEDPYLGQFFAVLTLFTNRAVHDHLDMLVPLLAHEQQSVRFFTGLLIEEHLREGDTNCIPAVIAQLNDPDNEVRVVVIRLLANKWLAPSAQAAVPKLVELLKAPDPGHAIPIMAAISLAMIDSNKVSLATETLKNCEIALIKENTAEGIPDDSKDYRIANDPVRTGVLETLLMIAANQGKVIEGSTSEPPYAAVIRIARQLFPDSDQEPSLEKALTIIGEKHPNSDIVDASRVILKKIRKGE